MVIPVVGLDSLDGHGEPLANLIDEGSGRGNGGVGRDLQNAIARGVVDRRELVEAATAELQGLDVDLDGLAGDGELPAPPRPGAVPLARDPRDVVAPEDRIDGGDGHVDLMIPLEEEADPDRPVLPVVTDLEHTPPTGPQSVGPAIVGGGSRVGRRLGTVLRGREDGCPLLGVERRV